MSHVLITGANRGLGLGLVKLYLARPNTTVIAAVRDPASPSSKALLNLPKGENASVIVVRIESSSPTDPKAAVEELESKHGVKKVDVVIANAGIADSYGSVMDVKIEDMERAYNVNLYGVLRLFQAVAPLLEKAPSPKWISMSSAAGSLYELFEGPNLAYGITKVALNFLTAKIQQEHPNYTVVAMHPGWVQTDMGNAGAKAFGLEKAPEEIDDSVSKIQKVIDNATKESVGGKFVYPDGQVHPW